MWDSLKAEVTDCFSLVNGPVFCRLPTHLLEKAAVEIAALMGWIHFLGVNFLTPLCCYFQFSGESAFLLGSMSSASLLAADIYPVRPDDPT